MKNQKFRIFLLLLFITLSVTAEAQDSLRFRRDRGRDTGGRQSDTTRQGRWRRGGSLFSDSVVLTSSDYQLQIEKTYVVLDHIRNESDLGPTFSSIDNRLKDIDSVLAVFKDNVLNNSGALSLRNLQVFKTLLLNIELDLKEHREFLDSSENRLSSLRGNLRTLITDTVLRQLYRDSVVRIQFASQLEEMRETWRASTRSLRSSIATINVLQTHASSNSILTAKLIQQVNNLYTTSAAKIFGKEYNYLWEAESDSLKRDPGTSIRKAYAAEKKALKYYFKDTGNNRLVLLFIGLLFFFWIMRNIRTLRRSPGTPEMVKNDFRYLPSAYIIGSLVVMFSVAPLFDLFAPSAYVEFMQFLLLIMLTLICWKKWPRKLFFYWIVMAILYICFSFAHHLSDPGFWERSLFIVLNMLSIVFGLLFLSKMKEHLKLKGFLRFIIILHNVMNVLSIFSNVMGRFSLAQILGNAAIFSFTQAIGLAVFFRICMEAMQLQIIASRIRNRVQNKADYGPALASFGRPVMFLVFVLWLIVFATNLNVYTSLLNWMSNFLGTSRHVGNASFTLGGILLFFMIIWIAHLLQRYVGYFFGHTDTEDDVPNKGQRSRLLIARLVLLCLGYLLAVAASGVPVDRITIVLGALGVGIGLGLQNIVNNFVSGIILIFDRPLQIGDIVEIQDVSERVHTGRVREIGLRSSTLMTQDGAEVIIPNGNILSQVIVNWTLTNNMQRMVMDLNIKGKNDMEEVSTEIKKIISASPHVVDGKEPQILFTRIADDGFDIKAFFWCKDVFKSETAKSEVLRLLHEKLPTLGSR